MVNSLQDKTFGEDVAPSEYNALVAGVQDVYPIAEREIAIGRGPGLPPVKRQFPVIDVTHPPFNAAGDGVTNDTAAIQAALDAAASGAAGTNYSTDGAKKLYFPAGTYLISSAIDFTGQWLSVDGDGPSLTVFKATHANARLTFSNSRAPVGGFAFDGNSLATVGLMFNVAASPTFTDIYVRGCAGNGGETHNLQNAVFNNVNFANNAGSGLVVDDGTGSCVFIRCEFNDNTKHQLLITETDAVTASYPQPTLNTFLGCLAEHQPVAASGTASAGGSTTTLVHTGAGWTVNQWVGAYVTKDPGGGAQAGARILSNTATVLTVEAGMWAAAPDALTYRIHWPSVRIDASNQSIFDNFIITPGSGGTYPSGEFPLLHLTRKGGTEAQATVVLRTAGLIGATGYQTGIEINGAQAKLYAGTDSSISGAKIGIRFTSNTGSTLEDSLPAFSTVTTPVVFVSGSMNNNAFERQNGNQRAITAYATADRVEYTQITGEAGARAYRRGDGFLAWGDGSNFTGDISISRESAGILQVGGKVHATGEAEIDGALNHDGTTVGFNAATPVTKRTLGAAATDAATTQTLANNLRQALIDLGLGQT